MVGNQLLFINVTTPRRKFGIIVNLLTFKRLHEIARALPAALGLELRRH
jgi:hypothetical protein